MKTSSGYFCDIIKLTLHYYPVEVKNTVFTGRRTISGSTFLRISYIALDNAVSSQICAIQSAEHNDK